MFGIGMSEMVIILAVALLVFGPDKLPEIAKSISKGLKELRRASDDLRSSVSTALDDDDTRMRPRVRPTAGIPDRPPPDADAPAHIQGSELVKDLPAPADASPALVPQAAPGAVARGDAEDGGTAGTSGAGVDDAARGSS